MKPTQVYNCTHTKALLGESPLWVGANNSIYWVDIFGKSIYQYQLDSKINIETKFNEEIYWLQLTIANRFVAAMQSGIWLLDIYLNKLKLISPKLKQAHLRFNDAKVDNEGRLWFGTMDNHEEREDGALYCLNKGKLTQVDSGYLVTNGPAFSTGNKTLYHNDTGNKRVFKFELDAKGKLTNKSLFIDFNFHPGFPDGMTVDQDDNIWIAHWQGGGISQFSPQGQLIQFIELPVNCVTSITFAGDNLDRLFATTASIKDDSAQAGSLFEIQVNAKGFAPYFYLVD